MVIIKFYIIIYIIIVLVLCLEKNVLMVITDNEWGICKK